MSNMKLPILLNTDSYKAGHPHQRPSAKRYSAYFTCRGPLVPEDNRIVFFGAGYLHRILSQPVTMQDIEEADKVFDTYLAGGRKMWWPRDLWLKVVTEHEGRMPFNVYALEDGEVFKPGTPAIVIEAENEFAPLVTWIESLVLQTTWSIGPTN